MKLILAQGNPGSEYTATRHNIGWMVLDAFTASHGAAFQPRDKFKADIAELNIEGEKIILAKPTTYYNETGQSARAIIDFYKLDIATDVLVVHDDLALPFGRVRTREKGSDAGNNGIKSLNSHLGHDYKRIRIGIWNEDRDQRGDVDFVLGKFSASELEQLPKLIELCSQTVDSFINGTFQITSMA